MGKFSRHVLIRFSRIVSFSGNQSNSPLGMADMTAQLFRADRSLVNIPAGYRARQLEYLGAWPPPVAMPRWETQDEQLRCQLQALGCKRRQWQRAAGSSRRRLECDGASLSHRQNGGCHDAGQWLQKQVRPLYSATYPRTRRALS